jgi:hypothetical protein
MTYEEYIQESDINPHTETFTYITRNGYYVECNVLNCKFKDGPFDIEEDAFIRGNEHADNP